MPKNGTKIRVKLLEALQKNIPKLSSANQNFECKK